MAPVIKSETAKIYRPFEDTERLMIEVSLDKYEDLFNEWDPAPFKRRDIDPDLRTFLEECSDEIGLKYPLAVVFYLPKGELDLEKQQKCIESLRSFFRFNHYLALKSRRNSRRDALRYFVIGAIFLSIAVGFDHVFEKNMFSNSMKSEY